MIVVLTGGTGGAKLIEGLAAEIDPAELTIVCNTGDDCLFHGLHISPDIDTVAYTLAGLIDHGKGWGIQGDTFIALEKLHHLGNDTWFQLGDKDLATHITRTWMLKEGRSLSEITDHLRRMLGIRSKILPMSDQRIETRVTTARGEVSFQEFFVKEHWKNEVNAVRFIGAEESQPAPGVLEAIDNAKAVIVCPSNPVTSIGAILAVPGIRAGLMKQPSRVVGVSPIIGAAAVSGPAHKLMRACGYEASALGVAQCYGDFLDALLVANEDRNLIPAIEQLRIRATTSDILMPNLVEKRRLSRELLALAQK